MPVFAHSDPIQAFNDRAKAAGWTFACGPAQGFRRPELTAALALWREKANGRAMPDRSDLTARVMKPYMANMTLLERISLDGRLQYRIRLHGSALARYGESTGKLLSQVVTPERIGAYAGIYDTVLELLMPLRVVSHYQAPEIEYLVGESMVAPLSVRGSAAPMILSVTYAEPRSELCNLNRT
jgi:hypothetical protein